MNKYILIICAYLLSLTLQVAAQSGGKIVGSVTDATNGQPLIGSSVFIENLMLGKCDKDILNNKKVWDKLIKLIKYDEPALKDYILEELSYDSNNSITESELFEMCIEEDDMYSEIIEEIFDRKPRK